MHAAAPCPVAVKRQMIEWWGPIISEYYAGTEGGGLTWIGSEDWLAHPGSVGRAAWGEIHICAESERSFRPVSPAWCASVGARTRSSTTTIRRRPPDLDQRGWSTLWDVGYLDGDGYLYLTDRLTYMIVSGV